MIDRSALRKLAIGFPGRFEYRPEHTDGELGVDDVLAYVGNDGNGDPYLIATNLEDHVAWPIAEMLNSVPHLLDQLDRAEAAAEHYRAQVSAVAAISNENLAQLSACRAALEEACDIAERWAPNASPGKYETGSLPSSRERISQLRCVGKAK